VPDLRMGSDFLVPSDYRGGARARRAGT
jgi:hypothetical protein